MYVPDWSFSRMPRILLLFLSVVTTGLAQPYDLVIRNGRVVDGTGNPWYYADVAIQSGRIAKIGDIPASEGKQVIDAKRQIVAPGFIDIHTHVEGNLAVRPTADNFVQDGVTTLITGNCGSSRTDLRQLFDSLRLTGISPNLASLIGHNAVRLKVMKAAFREPTLREQAEMEALVEKAMQAGAVGLSTGLIYTPGTFARTPEIVNLVKVAAKYCGVYASHIRNEGLEVHAAVQEAIQIGREAQIPVQISHFKVASKPLWGRSSETLALVGNARQQEGIDVTIDQYPYTASSTSLQSMLPNWALADGDSAMLSRLRDKAVRQQICDEMLASLEKSTRPNYDYAVIARFEPDTTYNGKSIHQIARLRGLKANAASEADLILLLIEQAQTRRVQMVYHIMAEEDVATIMRYPNTMIASDAGVARFGVSVPHPRAYGTNARVLGRYVREQKVIPLEEAVRRMTSLPAQRFRFADRGLLRPGYAADLVIFDENTIRDQATYDAPHAYPTGFSYVLINGVPVVDGGKHTGKRPGQMLLGSGYRP